MFRKAILHSGLFLLFWGCQNPAPVGASGTSSANSTAPNTNTSENGGLQVPGDPYGHFSLSNAFVYGFSQGETGQEDTQVYTLNPDVNMRAWQKWDLGGRRQSDFNSAYLAGCRSRNILFVAGGTASVVFRDEASSTAEFEDWATRDAKGGLVEHTEIVPGAYRASMASPAYRQYLVSIMKEQIDQLRHWAIGRTVSAS